MDNSNLAPVIPLDEKRKKKKRSKARRRPKGFGCVFRKGKTWAFRLPVPGRPKAPIEGFGFESEALAMAALELKRHELRNQRSGIVDPKTIPRIKDLGESWLERRQLSHQDLRTDRSRWKCHVLRHLGHLALDQVDAEQLRHVIDTMLAEGDNPSTIRRVMALLSSFYNDERHAKYVRINPVYTLSKQARELMRSKHDPKTVPFLRSMDDAVRVYQALPRPINVAYAIGVFGGLRPGEILGLMCEDFLLDQNMIHVQRQVQEGVVRDLKDARGEDRSRFVPIQDVLLPIVTEYIAARGGKGYLFEPTYPGRGGRPDLGRPAQFLSDEALNKNLKKVLNDLGLQVEGKKKIKWYEATKHTFASHWVLRGRSLSQLAAILGHSNTEVTARYAHLDPRNFSDSEREVFKGLDLRGGQCKEMRASATKRRKASAARSAAAGQKREKGGPGDG
jgi:integrase